MKKYFSLFLLSWQMFFQYRFDFFMERIRDLITIATLYFLWLSVFTKTKLIVGLTQNQVVGYVILSTFIFSFIFVYAMDDIGNHIASGELNFFLVKPIDFLGQWFVRRISRRIFVLLITSLEMGIFYCFFRPQIDWSFLPQHWWFWLIFSCWIILAVVLFTLFDFLIGLAAFWTFRAYGPRFLAKVFAEFASGKFFPLLILPKTIFSVLNFLPFAFLTYWPTGILLGTIPMSDLIRGFGIMGGYIFGLFVLLKLVWEKGLREYEGVGG